MDVFEAYLLLGIEPGASLETAREAKRDLQRLLHPDRHGDDARLTEKATARSREVNEAFEVLKRAGFPSAASLPGRPVAPAPPSPRAPRAQKPPPRNAPPKPPPPEPTPPPRARADRASAAQGFALLGNSFWAGARLDDDARRPRYQGIEYVTQRPVLVELLLPATTDAAIAGTLRSDCERFKALRDPHTLRLLANGQLADNTPFLVREWPDGSDLPSTFGPTGAVHWRGLVEICLQICTSLGEAHAAGIVHGAVTPRSVFLTRFPSQDAVVARLQYPITRIAPVSHKRADARYRPAESVFVPATDAFALGAVGAALLVGIGWFEESDRPPHELLGDYARRAAEPAYAQLATLFGECLADDKARRPAIWGVIARLNALLERAR